MSKKERWIDVKGAPDPESCFMGYKKKNGEWEYIYLIKDHEEIQNLKEKVNELQEEIKHLQSKVKKLQNEQ